MGYIAKNNKIYNIFTKKSYMPSEGILLKF